VKKNVYCLSSSGSRCTWKEIYASSS